MNKILGFFAKDKLVVTLIIISVTMFGLVGLRSVKKEAMPQVDIDQMKIIVTYPGASSSDVELNAVIPIENVLKDINGIDKIQSVALENMGIIQVDIAQDISNKQAVKDEIFREVTLSNISDIPEEVEKIRIVNINPKLKPVYVVSVSIKPGTDTKDKELYQMIDTLENLLSRVDGVSSVNKKGYRDREIQIDVLPGKLDYYNISLTDIVRGISARNIRSTGGTIQSVQKQKTIVTIGQFEDPMEVKNVIIRSGFEQKRITVKDLAIVSDHFADEEIRVLVNDKKGVVLVIKKNENADVITTVNNIKKFFKENKSLYVDKFDVTLISDDSKTISSLLQVVASNALIGFILVIIVLFIFLDLKTSLWTAFGIPFSMMIVVGVMYIFDVSINTLTIGAIITVLGMLVDDAIVVAENIFEKKQSGINGFEAAVQGTSEIIVPVCTTILSTIVAFMPMMMIKGIMGKFIFLYPVVIAITLLASLFESAFILPSHLAYDNHVAKDKGAWFIPVMEWYENTLKKVLYKRYLVSVAFVVLLVLTVIFSQEAIKGFILFWDDSSETITVNITTSPGTTLVETEKQCAKVVKLAADQIEKKDLVSTYLISGMHSGHGLNVETHDNWAALQIQLTPKTKRKKSAEDYSRILRKEINTQKLPQFQNIIIQPKKQGPPTGAPIDVKVMSSNEKDAIEVTSMIKKYLSTMPGVYDIDDDQKKGTEELYFKFNHDRIAQYGLNVQTIAQTVRTAFQGTKATYIQTPTQKIEFKVQVDSRHKVGKDFLMNLLIPNKTNRLIRLKDVAKVKTRDGKVSIKHYNGDRAISITAEVDSDVTTPGMTTKKIKKTFSEISSKYPGLYLDLAGESKETIEAMRDLGIAFMVAAVLIYLIIVLLFRSVTQPFIVMSVIPFGLIGVLIAFTMHGIPLSFMAIIGIIGLSGVVINDSIIMVNYINSVIKQNKKNSEKSIIENIAQGAKRRLRPIILTTLTTVVGLMPTVYGIGGDAKMMVPTVMAMAYGLLFATLLTLYFIPVLYLINIDINNLLSEWFAKIRNQFAIIKDKLILSIGIYKK